MEIKENKNNRDRLNEIAWGIRINLDNLYNLMNIYANDQIDYNSTLSFVDTAQTQLKTAELWIIEALKITLQRIENNIED